MFLRTYEFSMAWESARLLFMPLPTDATVVRLLRTLDRTCDWKKERKKESRSMFMGRGDKGVCRTVSLENRKRTYLGRKMYHLSHFVHHHYPKYFNRKCHEQSLPSSFTLSYQIAELFPRMPLKIKGNRSLGLSCFSTKDEDYRWKVSLIGDTFDLNIIIYLYR